MGGVGEGWVRFLCGERLRGDFNCSGPFVLGSSGGRVRPLKGGKVPLAMRGVVERAGVAGVLDCGFRDFGMAILLPLVTTGVVGQGGKPGI